MKWIKIAEGRYKLVDDNDPRPEDKSFAGRKPTGGTFYTVAKPPWMATLGKLDKSGNNPDNEKQILSAFDEERRKTTAISQKWAKWEKARKEDWQKNKPLWVKRGRKMSDLKDIQ